jgi:hypothetical protein
MAFRQYNVTNSKQDDKNTAEATDDTLQCVTQTRISEKTQTSKTDTFFLTSTTTNLLNIHFMAIQSVSQLWKNTAFKRL